MNKKTAKIFSLSVALMLASVILFAQEESSARLRYGVRIGGIVSYFSNQQPHTSEKLGFTLGGVVEYSLSNNFSVQTEPAYMQQGGKFVRFVDDTRFGNDETLFSKYVSNSNITIHSIDLPVLAKYKLPKVGEFQPNVVGGVSVGYTLFASDAFERTYTFDQTFSTINGNQIVTSQYEKFQVGLSGGVGGEVGIGGSKRLLIDLRYRYGVTPVKKGFSYIDLYNVQGDLRTHAVYFTLGLGF